MRVVSIQQAISEKDGFWGWPWRDTSLHFLLQFGQLKAESLQRGQHMSTLGYWQSPNGPIIAGQRTLVT